MTDLEMAAKFREAAQGVGRGWNKYTIGHPHLEAGAQCALGWLTVVAGHDGAIALYRLANERLGQVLPEWNDAPARTRQDVIALFEDLAHDLELKAQIAAQQGEDEKPQEQEERVPVPAVAHA